VEVYQGLVVGKSRGKRGQQDDKEDERLHVLRKKKTREGEETNREKQKTRISLEQINNGGTGGRKTQQNLEPEWWKKRSLGSWRYFHLQPPGGHTAGGRFTYTGGGFSLDSYCYCSTYSRFGLLRLS
jgi:hypothetical protein